MGILNLLSKRERELLERDTYLKGEYGIEMADEWCFGDERVVEIHSEWNSLSNGYLFEDYSER